MYLFDVLCFLYTRIYVRLCMSVGRLSVYMSLCVVFVYIVFVSVLCVICVHVCLYSVCVCVLGKTRTK